MSKRLDVCYWNENWIISIIITSMDKWSFSIQLVKCSESELYGIFMNDFFYTNRIFDNRKSTFVIINSKQ